MNLEAFKVMINNTALLLSMVVVFYLLWNDRDRVKLRDKVLSGFFLGIITIGIMTNPFIIEPGLVFDSRTIIIGLSAIFFSPVSSLICMLIAIIFRVFIGGFIWTGIISIFAAFVWGLLIRIYKQRKNLPFNHYDFLLLAMLNHLSMMVMVFLIPAQYRANVLYSVNLPILLTFPITTLIVGHLLVRRTLLLSDSKKLVLSEERYRLLAESSNDIIMIRTLKGKLIYANKIAKKLLGLEDADLGKVDILDFITEDFRPEYSQYYTKNAKEVIQNRHALLCVRDKDGRKRWVESISNPVWEGENFHGVMISARDISSRVQAEAQQQRHAARLEILRDLGNMVLQSVSFDQSCSLASQKLQELIAFDILSINICKLDKVEAVEILKTPGRFEYLHKNQSHTPSQSFLDELLLQKSIIVNEITTNPSDMPVRARLVKDGISSFMYNALMLKDELLGFLWFGSFQPGFFSEEHLEIGQDFANQLAISLNHLSQIHTIQENSQELARVVDDKTRELQSALAEVETFSYTVAHDLRAPLKMIQGYVEFLEEDYSSLLDAEGNKMLNAINRIVRHSDKLIVELLDLARLNTGAMQWQRTNMRNLVDDALKTLNSEGIGLEIYKLPDTWGDPSLLGLVWQNLLENAIKYTQDRDFRMITVGAKAGPEGYIYYVEDNGIGFDPQDAELIFAPFKRLRSEQNIEGTGIGLAIVKKIVLLHKGKIWAESEPGKGSGFYFSLPPLRKP